MGTEFHFIWGFLIGTGVGVVVAFWIALRIVKQTVRHYIQKTK